MMGQKRVLRIGGLSAAVAILAGGAWWLSVGGRQTEPVRLERALDVGPSELEHAAQAEEATQVPSEGAEGFARAANLAESSRVVAAEVALAGRVTTEEGAPIEGAEITWTALDLEHALPALAHSAERRQSTSNASRATRSKADGSFSFDSIPDGGEGASVVWATAFGMEGNALAVNVPTTSTVEVRLARGVARSVRVVDSTGAPVPGAQVEQYGFGALDRDYGDPWSAAAAQAFRRTATTGADGTPDAPFFSANGGERLRAWRDTLASDTWREALEQDDSVIELVLSPSFACFGVVTCSDSTVDLGGLVIDAWSQGSRPGGSAAVAEVRSDGTWGPIDVPCTKDTAYRLSLAGPGIASDEVDLGFVSPGATIRRDFEAVAELVLPIEIVDQDGGPIERARCTAYWAVGEIAVGVHGSTDGSGRAELRGARPGWVKLLCEADGYSNAESDWLEILESPEVPIRIAVSASRRVHGRVVHEGEPVESFRIVWWTAESILTSLSWEREFAGRADGRFELESAPSDTVWLMAEAREFSRSAFLRADPEAEDELVLELMPSCRAEGRVVDAETGKPISGASVLLYMNRGNQYLQPKIAPVLVDAGGRFEIAGLAPGDNRLVVEAPGYARNLAVAFGSTERALDIGSIPMQRTRELALVLVGDGPIEAGDYTATLKGTRYLGPIGFDAEGVASFPGVSPGIATWEIFGPGGWSRREIHTLAPGADWVFEVDVVGGPELTIQVASPSGDAVPDGIALTVFGVSPRGRGIPGMEALVQVTADDEGRARVRGLMPGPVAVEAVHPDGSMGAAARGVLEPEGSRLEVSWTSRKHTFRVLDRAGRPVPEVDVFLVLPEGGSCWNSTLATDDSGEVTFHMLPHDDVIVGAKHPELGMLPGRPLRLSEEVGATTLRFGDMSELDVLLVEGGTPSPGVQVSLFTGGFRFVAGDIASDGEGRVRWPNLAEGTYSMRIVHPGFWPGHAQVPTTSEGKPHRQEIFRTGSTTLRLRTGSEVPLAGQAIELEHIGLGEGPADWLSLGLLDSSSALTVSDAEGNIGVEQWPRGTYRWTARLADGTERSGTFDLNPGANPPIELRIQ